MATPLDYALAYAAIGWPVFPCDGKRPHALLGATGGFKHASRNPELLRRWWTQAPEANLGVPTGKVSGFWVLDVDPRNNGDSALQALLDAHRATGLSALVQQTGGGGTHYLFAYDPGVRKGKLGEGIDVKRDGGYIIVEPSVTQARYAFQDWDVLTGELPELPAAPAWLLRQVAIPAEGPVNRGAANAKSWNEDLRKLRSALSTLSADDYHEWITIGAALYHAAEGAPEALELWLEWSRTSPKFDQLACTSRWETFAAAPARRATLGSIYWRASELGWRWGRPRQPDGAAAATGDDQPPNPAPPDAGEPEGDDDPLPRIDWIDGELPRAVDEAEAALMRSAEGLYRRGDMLVRVVRRESSSVRNFRRRQPQDLGLRVVDQAYLVEALTRVAYWRRWDKRNEDWRRINCPPVVAATYLSRQGHWRVPPLLAAITAPTLRPDGTVLQQPGYDGTTATWYDPCGFEYPEIRDDPNREEAEEALHLLRKAFSTFPFEAPVDEAVALSLALTALVRRSLPTAPLGAITAPVMASGKTLLADLISILASGVAAPAMQFPETDEEAKKVALAVLAAGDPVVLIDNIERPLQGDWLCTALTSETFSGRMLGVTEMLKVPTCTQWLATGNQLAIAGDLRTRALMCRLDPKMEKPEQRAFATDIRVWFTEKRPKLVAAGLTILRAWMVSGVAPGDVVRPWGRFEAWSNMVRSALVWLGVEDPYLSTRFLDDEDPYRAELLQVLNTWYGRFSDEEMTVAVAIEAANDALDNRAIVLLEALRTVAGDRGGTVNARRLGHWLRRHAGRIVEGKKIERGRDKDGAARWRVEQLAT